MVCKFALKIEENRKMINFIVLATIVWGLVFATICYLLKFNDATISIIAGVFGLIINFLVLSLAWKLIFLKKSIALAVLVIIFKYLILALVLWAISTAPWFEPVGFVLALASFLLAIVCSTIFKKRIKKE